MKKKQVLKIDRGTWLHGEGLAPSFLLRPEDGKKCCLGFYCISLGATKKEIKGRKYPDHLEKAAQNRLEKTPGSWLFKDRELMTQLANINDASLGQLVVDVPVRVKTCLERQRLIKKGFAAQGVKVVFTGKCDHT